MHAGQSRQQEKTVSSKEHAQTKDAFPAFQMSEAELLDVMRSSLYPGAADQSIKLVIGYCKATNLDPMQKPVHLVPMNVKDSKTGKYDWRDVVMPGIGLYRTQASRSGEYSGISEPEFGPDVTEELGGTMVTYPLWCRVTALRGEGNAFTAKEFWKENYATGGKDTLAPNAMWRKRPYAQLAKCAEAQALRKAFPEAAGSQPTAEEMEGKTFDDAIEIDKNTGEVLNRGAQPAKSTPTLPAYTEDQFAKNAATWKAAVAAKKQSPESIIRKVSTSYTLSEAQEKAIRGFATAQLEHTQNANA